MFVVHVWVRREFAQRCLQGLQATYDDMKLYGRNLREVEAVVSKIEVRAWKFERREIVLMDACSYVVVTIV